MQKTAFAARSVCRVDICLTGERGSALQGAYSPSQDGSCWQIILTVSLTSPIIELLKSVIKDIFAAELGNFVLSASSINVDCAMSNIRGNETLSCAKSLLEIEQKRQNPAALGRRLAFSFEQCLMYDLSFLRKTASLSKTAPCIVCSVISVLLSAFFGCEYMIIYFLFAKHSKK